MQYLWAFLAGGAICAIVQIFVDKTKLMPGRIMVGLVVIGVILGGIGIYDSFIEWAGAGAGVPLLSFGNTLIKGVKEAVDEKGFLGVFQGGLTGGAGGITAAMIFGYLGALCFKTKIKE